MSGDGAPDYILVSMRFSRINWLWLMLIPVGIAYHLCAQVPGIEPGSEVLEASQSP